MPAEVAIYLVGGIPVGGFLRVNSLKGKNENLNAKGMILKKFCISEIREDNSKKYKEAIYSIIGRISTIAGISGPTTCWSGRLKAPLNKRRWGT